MPTCGRSWASLFEVTSLQSDRPWPPSGNMWNSVLMPFFCKALTSIRAFSTGTQSSGWVCQTNVGGVSFVTKFSSD